MCEQNPEEDMWYPAFQLPIILLKQDLTGYRARLAPARLSDPLTSTPSQYGDCRSVTVPILGLLQECVRFEFSSHACPARAHELSLQFPSFFLLRNFARV